METVVALIDKNSVLISVNLVPAFGRDIGKALY
jgi:hypothetical protein